MEILFPVSRVFALTTAAAAALSNGRRFLLCNSNRSVSIEVNDSVYLFVIRITYRMSMFPSGGRWRVSFIPFSKHLNQETLLVWGSEHRRGCSLQPRNYDDMECRT